MKQRIITAIVLIAILLPCVIYGGIAFKIMVALLSLAAVYEFLSICQEPKTHYYLYVIFGFFTLFSIFYNSTLIINTYYILILLIVLFSCSMYDESLTIDRLSYYFTTSILVTSGFQALAYIRNEIGLELIILLALVTFGTDSGAYFSGRLLGKHKLNPRLSPNKTIEGSIGGMLLGTGLSVAYGAYIGGMSIPFLCIVCLSLTITSQIGDLTFSSIKRHFNIKDYSQIFPGHGGVLDRFDSILFNAITFTVLIYILL